MKMMIKGLILFFVVGVSGSLGAMKEAEDNFHWDTARFNEIVRRNQLRFHDKKWLFADKGICERHYRICQFLNQKNLSHDELIEFFETVIDYYLLLHMRWELRHDLIAVHVRDGIEDFFKGFIDLPFEYIDQEMFINEAEDLSVDITLLLGMNTAPKMGLLEAAFYRIFKFWSEPRTTDMALAKIYAIAYVQDDVLKILDGLKRIDELGARDIENFGTVAAQVIILRKKLETIGSLHRNMSAIDLSERTVIFFEILRERLIVLCSRKR
jgi:hypothetical protein